MDFRVPIKYTPHEYQVLGIQTLVSPTGGGLFLKPGMGKTSMMLAAFKLFRNKKIYKKMLVVAPLRVAQLVWPEEIEQWADFNQIEYTVLHGPTKNERLKQDVEIYTINFEGLDWIIPKILNGTAPKFDILVVDESSRMRNTDGKRYKALKKVLAKFSRRYILTGTPQPKALYNLFGQMYIADLGASLGRFITHFRGEYFYKVEGDEFEYHPFDGAAEKIYDKIQHKIFHLSDKDYLTLPEVQEVTLPVILDAEARAKYRDMERKFFLSMEKGEIIAANAGVASGKCRQICNGFVYSQTEDGEQIATIIHDLKLQAYIELMDELQGEPALVVYQYEEDYRRMNDAVPGVKFTGAKNPEEIKARWDRGEIRALYIHPQSAGFGLNMQRGGCTMIWYGLTYNYEDYFQTIKRIDRQGQTKPVTIYRIVAANTLEDKVIIPVLAEREGNQEKLFSHFKAYWENKKARATLEGFEL